VNHDTLVKIVDIEPKSRAMTITFRGQPTARFIRGTARRDRLLHDLSEIFQKTEQELLAYEMPITKIIEENSVKDIQEIEDREFTIAHRVGGAGAAAEANGNVATPLNASQLNRRRCRRVLDPQGRARAYVGHERRDGAPVQRPDLVNLFKMLDGNRLGGAYAHDGERLGRHPGSGPSRTSATRSSRRRRSTATSTTPSSGVAYIRTIKTDILRPATSTSSPSRSSSGSSTS
jgi:hypothetical protein